MTCSASGVPLHIWNRRTSDIAEKMAWLLLHAKEGDISGAYNREIKAALAAYAATKEKIK